MDSAVDILILSNGPGELATWVKPVVRTLRQQLGNDRSQIRISIVLSPDANASGQEAAIANRYPEVDRVQAAADFFPFLLWGKTAQHWDWRPKGVILFLGGDQFYPVVIGKRLGYRTVVYAEWEARWHHWIDRFGVMQPEIAARASRSQAHKFSIVGDLMAEVGGGDAPRERDEELIGLLPGSKPAKLSLGVPLLLAIAEQIQQVRPNTRFVIAVAPTLELPALATFANPEQNPLIRQFGWAEAKLVVPTAESLPYLKTRSGLRVDLWTPSPAYELLSRCSLCLTTVGANTAELGALAVPMVVLLPTQQMETIKTWDGVPGLLANLPGIGPRVSRTMTQLALRRRGQLAWPNIWAKREIVPELAGQLQPEEVAAIVLDFLTHPKKLQQMRDQLRSVRGQPGAAEKLGQLVKEELEQAKI